MPHLMDLIVCQCFVTNISMTGSNESEQQGCTIRYNKEILQGQINLFVGKDVQDWAQYLLHFAGISWK